MHLEVMRVALYRETNAFLLGEDNAFMPHPPSGGIADGVASATS
jgi:hypothetical protein